MCHANQQNWIKVKSLSKAVHMAGQQQQEHYIHYVQETLEASVPFWSHPPVAGEGEAGTDGARGMGWAADL